MNLTKDSINKQIKKTYKHFKNRSKELTWCAVSTDIILITFGKEWYLKNKQLHLNKVNDSDEYDFQLVMRIIYLGHLIYSLIECDGFRVFINSMKNKDFEASNWELTVAQRFVTAGFNLKFVEEKGVKGEDYDMLAFRDDVEFHIEAKSRNRNINDENSLKNVLSKARKQLPSEGNGIIYISIPPDWVINNFVKNTIEQIILSSFRNTNRVKFVIIECEELQDFPPSGKARLNKFKTYSNGSFPEINLDMKTISKFNPQVFVPAYWSFLLNNG